MSLAIFFPFQHQQIKKRKERRVVKAKKSLFAILLENEGRSSIISLASSLPVGRRSQSHVSCILNQFSQTRTVLRATSLLLMDPGLHFQNDTKGKRNYCCTSFSHARKNENFFGKEKVPKFPSVGKKIGPHLF